MGRTTDQTRPCGHIHPNTGWPDLAYCTKAKNHIGPHYSVLKDLSWSETEREPRH